MHCFDILEIFTLEMGQISSDLLKKAFATWQYAFLSTSTTFYDIFAQACTEIKIFGQESPVMITLHIQSDLHVFRHFIFS